MGEARDSPFDSSGALAMKDTTSPATLEPKSPNFRSKTYKRSRRGCIQCRAQRKKCDEKEPECTRCYTNRRRCVYETQQGPIPRSKPDGRLLGDLESPGPELQASGSSPIPPLTVAFPPGSSSGTSSPVVPPNAVNDPTQPFAAMLPYEPWTAHQAPASYTPDAASQPSPRPLPSWGSFTAYETQVSVDPNSLDPSDPFFWDLTSLTSSTFGPDFLRAFGLTPPEAAIASPTFQDLISILPEGAQTGTLRPHSPPSPSAAESQFVRASTSMSTTGSSAEQGSSGPLSDGDPENELIHYFTHVASVTVFAIDREDNPSRKYYMPLVLSASAHHEPSAARNALLHALLAVAATHRYNLLRARGLADAQAQCADLALARRHKLSGIRLLKRAQDEGSVEQQDVAIAATIVLTLATIQEGASDLVPILLRSCSDSIARSLSHSSTQTSSRFRFIHFTYAFLYLYSVYNAISRTHDLEPRWLRAGERAQWDATRDEEIRDTVRYTVGVTMEMLDLVVRVHALANLNASLTCSAPISSPMSRGRSTSSASVNQSEGGETPGGSNIRDGSAGRDLEDGQWREIEAKAECDAIESELADQEMWARKWGQPKGTDVRIPYGLEAYRCALRVYILREVFNRPSRDERVQSCVRHCIHTVSQVARGTEIGLIWPAIICGCEALGDYRQAYHQFFRRCQWKGTPGPATADKLVRTAWARRDAGFVGTEASWRGLVHELGSPIMI